MSWKYNQFGTNNKNSHNYNINTLNPTKLHELKGMTDTISDISWFKQFVSCSSWDGCVYLWQTVRNKKILKSKKSFKRNYEIPIISCLLLNNILISGSITGIITAVDVEKNRDMKIGIHKQQNGNEGNSITCLKHIPERNLIASSSWNRKCCFWDTKTQKCSLSIPFPERIYDFDIFKNVMVVLCAGIENQQVFIFDLRNPKQPLKVESTGLNTMSRTISISPSKRYYAIGSIGGRVSIKPLIQKFKPFVFKCSFEGKNNAFPVNDICFNSTNLMGTVGSNGRYQIWNVDNKEAIFRFKKRISCSITKGVFNNDGNIYALGVSYDVSRGINSCLYKNKTHQRILLHV